MQQVFGDGIGDLRAFGTGWDTRGTDRGIHLAEAFPRGEEEGLVLTNGSARRRAVLVAMQCVLGPPQTVREEIRRIEIGIAKIRKVKSGAKMVRGKSESIHARRLALHSLKAQCSRACRSTRRRSPFARDVEHQPWLAPQTAATQLEL